MFQLALCCSSLETPRDLVVKEKPAAFLGNISTPDTRPPPTPGKAVAEHLVRLLSHVSKMAKPPSLSALLRVEKQLAEHFDSCDLPSLGLGSLDILHRNAQLLEETGVVISALGGSGATAGSFCPKRDELHGVHPPVRQPRHRSAAGRGLRCGAALRRAFLPQPWARPRGQPGKTGAEGQARWQQRRCLSVRHLVRGDGAVCSRLEVWQPPPKCPPPHPSAHLVICLTATGRSSKLLSRRQTLGVL
ncbi:uncharacterized protein LOC142930147 [Petromyzon marinus]|uniref:uncharacterized protein LOC142930147 n=1 Tax=Petromyzon marinus TaxID=7757 RepID=UPI003F6E749D